VGNDDPTVPSARLGELAAASADARELRADALELLAIGGQLEDLGRRLQSIADGLRQYANRLQPPRRPPADGLDET
jgi:hypothetical protein